MVEMGSSILESLTGPLVKYGINGIIIGALLVVGTYVFNFSLPVVKAFLEISSGVK